MVKQSQGDRGFPDIVGPGSLGTEQEGFWNRQHKYVFTHAHNRLCAQSVGWEHTVAVLPLDPANKGKMETVTHSHEETASVGFPVSPAHLHAA